MMWSKRSCLKLKPVTGNFSVKTAKSNNTIDWCYGGKLSFLKSKKIMDIKYYDLLSSTIVGVIVVATVNYVFWGNVDIAGVVYLALGYFIGYFINSIGSLFECLYFKMIGGMPSDIFLTPVSGQKWTGYSRVKFYETERVMAALRSELCNDNASTRKMFACAMRRVNVCENSRVQAFNAQYACSRTILTTVWITALLCVFRYYNCVQFWVIALLMFAISLNRFKERGYYYSREVLNEYLKQIKTSQR